MKIGCDIDGVITPLKMRINFKLPWWVFIFLIFLPPDKKMLITLISWSTNHKIILISSRPKKLNYLTQWWLNRNYVPHSALFLGDLGPGAKERKLEIIQREKIDLYIDDDQEIVDFLRERGVNALTPKGVLQI